MYAIYHGRDGLSRIANRVHGFTQVFKSIVERFGYKVENAHFFDTVTLDVTSVVAGAEAVHAASLAAGINLRRIDEKRVGVTFDESITPGDLLSLINVFASAASKPSLSMTDLEPVELQAIPGGLRRTSDFLPHPVFNKHHSETEMLRYIFHLSSKDVGLVHSMIPLGSCTMKLNSTSSMIPITWPEFGAAHPFAPHDQVQGYSAIIKVRFLMFLQRVGLKCKTGIGKRFV